MTRVQEDILGLEGSRVTAVAAPVANGSPTTICRAMAGKGDHRVPLRRERSVSTPPSIAAPDDPEVWPAAERLLLSLGEDAVEPFSERPARGTAETTSAPTRALEDFGEDHEGRALNQLAQSKEVRQDAEEALARLAPRPRYALHVHLLGPFRVCRGEEPVADKEWRTERARALLQLFASNRGVFLAKERIFEMLWPDLGPQAADNNFRFTLRSVNKVLEPHRLEGSNPYYIQRRGDAYGLDSHAAVWLDTEEFERLVRQDRADQRRGLAGRKESLDLYRRAVDLYADDYLPEQVYEDWTSVERERLRELYFHAAGSVAELLLHAGEPEEVVHLARAILDKDSCREDACRLLMRAHSRRGDRNGRSPGLAGLRRSSAPAARQGETPRRGVSTGIPPLTHLGTLA